MLRTILLYGVVGGLIVALPWVLGLHAMVPHQYGEIAGYAVMIVALTTVFIAIKDYRDRVLGGVIKFLPALGIGLGITVVAGVFYVGGFELYQMMSGTNYIDGYIAYAMEAERAKGTTGAELQAFAASMENMRTMMANPAIRMVMSFGIEFLPVGLVISLISAALLRNSRFMPARPAAA
jgi:hypothetical protein